MSKRLRKKYTKRDNSLTLSGNNGGDILELLPLENDKVYIRSGCSCVMDLDMVVPNEFLTLIIKDCMLKYGTVENYLKTINYDEEYKSELIGKLGKEWY